VRDLFPLLASSRSPGAPSVVVNPGGSEALLLTPSMVLDIVAKVKGYRPISITEGTDVAIGLPSLPLPDEALTAVIAVLEHAPHVVRCYQFEWQVEGVHDDPSLVLAIEFEEGLDDDERRRSFEAIQDGIEPELEDLDQPIDLIDIARQAELFPPLAETTEPFFSRSS